MEKKFFDKIKNKFITIENTLIDISENIADADDEIENIKGDVSDINEDIEELRSDKADKTELQSYYNKTETDILLNQKIDASALDNYYNKTQTDTLLNQKIDASALDNYYDKTETDTLLNQKIDASALDNYYNKTEADNLLNQKINATDLGSYVDRGINYSSNKIGHSNSEISPASTNDRMYPIKIDKYGHITSYGTGHAYSAEYKSSANNQLFLRNGAHAMWKQVSHLVGIFSRNSSQTFTMNAWSNISLTGSNDTDGTYAQLASNGIKILVTGIYRFDITVRMSDSISSDTLIEWAVGITGHDDDSAGGAWLTTKHRHKITIPLTIYVTANSIVYPRIYSTGGINTINYCNVVCECIKIS